MTIPLIVGVTGHRDIPNEELAKLAACIRVFFEKLKSDFPNLPVTVLNPLAEGADQLVCQVALDMGISVHALLPMPLVEYEKDFSGDVLSNFRALPAQCEVIELPMLDSQTHARDEQYIQLAGYLAAHSHILLALWDGEETYVPGATSAVIRFHQHDTMAQLAEADPLNPIDFIEDESDLVYHITCSRVSGDRNNAAGDTAWLTRDDVAPRSRQIPERYRQVFDHMAEFNRDVEGLPDRVDAALLIDNTAARSTRVRDIAALFSDADRLATQNQSRMLTSLRSCYALILMAGLSFITYADLYSQPYMVQLYVCFMAALLLVFRLEAFFGWQRKYLDYRALAEARRVQFYWSMAGVTMDRAHHFAHDSFHERRELQLGWIRNVMRVAAVKSDALLSDASAKDIEHVVQSWIRDPDMGQSHYYERKSMERQRHHRTTRMMETASMVLVMTVAVVLIFREGGSLVTDMLIALVGFIPFVMAVRQNYAHRMAEKELIGQYQYFRRIFSSADALLARTTRNDTRQQILRALGEAALDESSQWLLRQRERPVSGGALPG